MACGNRTIDHMFIKMCAYQHACRSRKSNEQQWTHLAVKTNVRGLNQLQMVIYNVDSHRSLVSCLTSQIIIGLIVFAYGSAVRTCYQ